MSAQKTTNVPQPKWQVIYNGAAITGDIESMVTEIRWHEVMSNAAADISITVQDTQGQWHKSTYPTPGDLVQLSFGYAGAPLLNCGTFTLDEFEFHTPPSTMILRGIEAWVTAQLLTPNSVAYENMTIPQIANMIALKHGWQLVSSDEPVNPDAPWARKTQYCETDLDFMRRLADENNYVFNVRPPQLIFYSLPALEAATPAVPSISLKGVMRAELRHQSLADRSFTSGQTVYFDSATKQLNSAQGQAVGPGASAVTENRMNWVQRTENNQQAAQLAASALHQANMMQYQGEIELPGTTTYRAGATVSFANDWGIFGSATVGNWIILEAEHIFSARGGSGTAGYRTKLTVRTPGPDTQITPGGAAGATDQGGSQ